jgi:hypothetical protein
LTRSSDPVGVLEIVPVVVVMFVNVPVEGEMPPITLLLIVLFVIVNPD